MTWHDTRSRTGLCVFLGSFYVPTLLRELLLSESEGMVDRTLYVEPARTQRKREGTHSDVTHR